MNKFEKKAIEIEALQGVYEDIERRISWEMSEDEEGRQVPYNERAEERVKVLREIQALLEKRL